MKLLFMKTGMVAWVSLASCSQAPEETASLPAEPPDALLRAGQVIITQADLDHHLQENHAGRDDAETRRLALDELARRASFTQAAIDAGLDADPLARAEIARILTARLREKQLFPRLETAAKVPEARLREMFEEQAGSFQSPEKRQLAVLWLNPGVDPERTVQYREKLEQARRWFFEESDLKEHPEQGFSVLSIDHSERAASRFTGGVLGWIESGGGMDAWTKAVAEIGFSLKIPGDLSSVVARSEGIFLVRYMALQPASLRPFDAVADELERTERQNLRQAVETEFTDSILEKYPVQWQKP